ncbi:hypothetical protein [Streptomyces sp. SID3343]|nr:hypothetical protein [Streptomyces sp. SID3343]
MWDGRFPLFSRARSPSRPVEVRRLRLLRDPDAPELGEDDDAPD